jgi:ribosome modulation factor
MAYYTGWLIGWLNGWRAASGDSVDPGAMAYG